METSSSKQTQKAPHRIPVLRRKLSSLSLSLSTLAKEHSLSTLRTQYLGLSCALVCALLGSCKGWMVSELADVGPAQIVGLRSVGAICFLSPLIIIRRSRLTYNLRTNLLLCLRSLFGNVAVAGYYFGFAYLPLAEASLIFYSTPIYTTLIGCLFLGERVGPCEALSLFLCASGVALVSCPTFIYGYSQLSDLELSQSLQGVVGCLLGALAQAIATVILRKLDTVNAEVVSFWWALTGVIMCVGANGLLDHLRPWSCGYESALVVLLALVGFLSELAMVVALSLEQAGPVSVALTSEILWAFVLQAGLQREIPNGWTIAGALFITMSLAVPAVGKWYRARRIRVKFNSRRKDYEELRSGEESVQVIED